MGRPKGSKNKPKIDTATDLRKIDAELTRIEAEAVVTNQEEVKKRKGRPKGSKNKAKVQAAQGPGIRIQLINREGEIQEEKLVIIEAMMRREQTYTRVGKHLERQAWDAAENLKYQAWKEAHKRGSKSE